MTDSQSISPIILTVSGLACITISYVLFSKLSSPSSSTTPKSTTATTPATATKAATLGVINIYFGSQTGTAEGFARQIEGDDHGFTVNVKDLEDFDADSAEDEMDEMKEVSRPSSLHTPVHVTLPRMAP